ncbi:uncharacterized protein LOC122304486 [Carya illinoinensis]|uniref:uncharacterized protein LOC122304486 n=1 Tax=Carya illinoinensis TaxID=32201 RepID=UPI001C7216F0|nr:uncharacterized protein LOC122304486 [Carya illinoinensis]
MAEWCYNTTVHSTINITPFEALYGYPPPNLLAYVPGTSSNDVVDNQLRSREELLILLRDNMLRAQQRMKYFANGKRSDRSFEVGDWIVQKLGTVAYKLNLPESSKIHPVFHVSCLKKKLGQHIVPLPTLPPTDFSSHVQPEPQHILERRLQRKGNHAIIEVLVSWVGATAEDASWESLYKLRQLYPHLVGTVL